MVDKVKKQLRPGRPRTATNKAKLPSEPTQPKVPSVPKVSGELPKEVIGSHMGVMLPKSTGPAIPRPPKLPPRGRIAPRF